MAASEQCSDLMFNVEGDLFFFSSCSVSLLFSRRTGARVELKLDLGFLVPW
jgi:hypothetical protein